MAEKGAPKRRSPTKKAARRASEGPGYLDVVRNFEHAMVELERRADLLMREAYDQGADLEGLDLHYGVSIQPGREGMRFQAFGNLGETLKDVRGGWRAPLVTWHVEGDVLRLRAELPGVAREDVELEVDRESVYLEAEGEEVKFRAECRPGGHLSPQDATAEFQHGVLRVTVPLERQGRRQGRRVPVQ